tara:strand:- start:2109 stop:4712 length:2604 start_codon:yes stop_codon:yes gene_type:complete
MSNYTKSFNFRNGVQVDDSSLVVNANGLVGIGTTRPEKKLDVFGNARVSGLTSVSTLNVTNVVTIGTGITMDSTTGIVTAVKFVGDASGLQNIIAIATDGFIANAGTLSTVGSVGIGTTIFTNPTPKLEVRGDSKFFDGVTTFEGSIISKNINSTGVITATDFAGAGGTAAPFVNINVGTAATIGVLTVTDGSTFDGDVSLPDNKKIKLGNGKDLQVFHGESPFSPGSAHNSYIQDSGTGDLVLLSNQVAIRNASETQDMARFYEGDRVELSHNGSKKFETTGTGVTVTGNLGVSNRTFLKDLEVSGISTFNDTIELKKVSVGATVGFGTTAYFKDNAAIILGDGEDFEIYHGKSRNDPSATNQQSYIRDSGVGDLVLLSNQVAIRNATESEDIARFKENDGVELYHNNVEKLRTISIGASVFGQLNVARLNGGTNGLSASYGALRYGNEAGNVSFSTRKSVDLINYDTGNINFYLDGSNANSGIGSFVWHQGTSNRLMALTAEGNLGIGLVNPQFKLHVDGTAKISGLSTFGNGIKVTSGDITVTNSIKSSSNNTDLDFSTGIMSATTFKGNVDARDEIGGTSKFLNLIIESDGTGTGIATMPKLKIGSGIGVNEDPLAKVTFPAMQGSNFNLIDTYLNIKTSSTKRVFVTQDGQVGIFTDRMPGRPVSAITRPNVQTAIGVNVDTTVLVKALGIGTADFGQGSAVDFSNAGSQFSRYMIPPVINSADERDLLKGNSGTNLFTGTITAGSPIITNVGNFDIANLTLGTVVTITNETNINQVLPPTGVAKVIGKDNSDPSNKKITLDKNFGGTGSSNGSVTFNENGSNNDIPLGAIIFDNSSGVNKLRYFTGSIDTSGSDGGWLNVS